MDVRLREVERLHLGLLAVAVCAAYASGWLAAPRLLLGGAVMGANLWLMRQLARRMLASQTPRPTTMIALVIGEGGSGGAIAIASANRILMLEHAVYTVASPEAAASILWRDSTRAVDAATSMKITAQDLHELGVIDEIVPEPIGGAHRDKEGAVRRAGDAIAKALAAFDRMSPDEIRKQRHERFLNIGRSL